MQDELGHANDVRVAYSLVIELGRSATRVEPIADAGAQMLARHERALALNEKKLLRQLRRLNQAHLSGATDAPQAWALATAAAEWSEGQSAAALAGIGQVAPVPPSPQ